MKFCLNKLLNLCDDCTGHIEVIEYDSSGNMLYCVVITHDTYPINQCFDAEIIEVDE